ncbi:MAG: Crp/Fnr family transcriptional regulator [Pseudomonadota bacterium]|nr:Crp/Fnr family transcriptional regulator [Pseudomonadota bacterium]
MTIIKSSEKLLQQAGSLLRDLPLTAGIAAGNLQTLAGAAVLCRYEDGECLFHQHDHAGYWYLVISGRVDTFLDGADGEQRVVQHIPGGQLLAIIVMFMPHQHYPVSARAHGTTLVYRFSRQQLHRLCEAEPVVTRRILELAGRALCQRIEDVENLSSRNATQRLTAYLLRQFRSMGKQIRLPLSQKDLAVKLGVRPETISRLFRELQSEGVIRGGRRQWELLNAERLEQMLG